MLRLPGFDQDKHIFNSTILVWVICCLNFKLMFAPIQFKDSCAVFAQCIQASFPCAKHGDLIPSLRKPRGKKSCQGARAHDEEVVHFGKQVPVNLIDWHLFCYLISFNSNSHSRSSISTMCSCAGKRFVSTSSM